MHTLFVIPSHSHFRPCVRKSIALPLFTSIVLAATALAAKRCPIHTHAADFCERGRSAAGGDGRL